jgi:hypothetical protein
MLRRIVGQLQTRSYAEMYDWLDDGELLAEPPEAWAHDWALADPDSFHRTVQETR